MHDNSLGGIPLDIPGGIPRGYRLQDGRAERANLNESRYGFAH